MPYVHVSLNLGQQWSGNWPAREGVSNGQIWRHAGLADSIFLKTGYATCPLGSWEF